MQKIVILAAGAAGAAVGAIAWRLMKKPLTPVAINSAQPAPQAPPIEPLSFGNLDYLNFDFESLLFPWGKTVTEKNTYPLQGDNAMQPKGITNNNPLNIEYGASWQGLTGSDGRFATFETAFHGIRAAGRTLKTYRDKYGLNTVNGIINRWAPPSDNNPTQNYINFVANKAGVNQHTPLSMAEYPRVVAAMIHFENGFNPYDITEITNAVNAGFA
ncbi:hypothetical protein [Shewanella sp. TB7-MNA-CIBAN-0143]|uniref:hypothetical protein n=1 Tax=Shewanella sp. TB7-MNA-CIBAN-0143 TaxID=3140465 RepID=UPI003323C704